MRDTRCFKLSEQDVIFLGGANSVMKFIDHILRIKMFTDNERKRYHHFGECHSVSRTMIRWVVTFIDKMSWPYKYIGLSQTYQKKICNHKTR